MTAETDIAAIADGGLNPALDVRTALTSVLARADTPEAHVGCSLTLTADQENITTAVAIIFDSEEWDTEGWHSNSVNPTRITPGVVGRYRVEGTLGVDNAVVNQVHTYAVYVNGAVARTFALFSVGDSEFSRSFSMVVDLTNAADYVEVFVGRTSGTGDFDVKALGSFTAIQVTRL